MGSNPDILESSRAENGLLRKYFVKKMVFGKDQGFRENC